MKKKLLKGLFLFAVGIALASCTTSKHSQQISGMERLPKPSVLFYTLDSIVNEAWQLYYSERTNWIASDLVLASHSMDELGGSISWQPNDSVWAVVFMDKEGKNCVFEYQYNTVTTEEFSRDSIRPITEKELAERERKVKIINGAVEKYGDQLFFANQSFGSPNVDIVRINDNLTRLYFMQGTIIDNVIPFGNDYSVDFDKDLNPIAFRKYHNSLLAIPTKTEDGGKVETIRHSHLKDNPFITPTDICNFLLYRPEGIDMFYVYSTAYKCTFAYSLKLNQIITAVD